VAVSIPVTPKTEDEMGKRIAALIFIFFCTSVAWMILGSSLAYRSTSTDETLEGEVAGLWGSVQYQYPPEFTYTYETWVDKVDEKTKKPTREKAFVTAPLPIEKSDITTDFSLDYRKKGLLWYSTYVVRFDGTYRVVNDTGRSVDLDILHKFPAAGAEYDDFHVYLDGTEVQKLTWTDAGVATNTTLPAGGEVVFRVAYTTRGLDEWHYFFGQGNVVEVKDFTMKMTTNFAAVDFPAGTISPTSKQETTGGTALAWEFTKRITGNHIGIAMPEKVNPGPMAERMTFFAPVSLLFFFFIIFIITTLKGINIHPMNYFFLATAFFAFHLLMAYLVDHLDIHLSFLISAVVSLFLVISYLRLVVGARFALVEAGLAQFVYLILFSYSFFFKGYTGLIITIASIVTLFMVMQLTGRIDWEEKFKTISQKNTAGPKP
jgi:inner membrane protein involved in colicin E2 resistance